MPTDYEYEIYLPVRDNDGNVFPDRLFADYKKSLTERFGGVTDTRIHNEGVWKIGNVEQKDDVVVWRVLSIGEGPQDTFM
ncbi:MAG: hypothetical protein EOP09_14785, partial [Proteobacteria bacterium]